MHSQCSVFHRKFTKYTKFPYKLTSDVSNTPPNRLLVTELLPTSHRNLMPIIEDHNASASNINIHTNVFLSQVADVHGLAHNIWGNKNSHTINAIVTSSSQHEESFDDAFAVLERNLREDYQQSLESNSVDESCSTNPRQDANKVQIQVGANANNRNFDVSQDRENNCVNPENPVCETATHNNQEKK